MNTKISEAVAVAAGISQHGVLECNLLPGGLEQLQATGGDAKLYLHPQPAELAEQQGDAVDELIESWTQQARERFEKNEFSVVAESLIICARELKAALAATGKQQVGENPAWRDELVREAHVRGLMEGLNNPRRRQVIEVQGDALADAVGRIFGCDGSPYRTRDLAVVLREFAARQPGAQEHVAVVGPDFTLLWAGSGPISPIVERHGLKRGSLLYAAPPAQGIDPSVGMAQEYRRWIDFYHAGEGSYDDFLSKHVLIDDQRDAAPGVGS